MHAVAELMLWFKRNDAEVLTKILTKYICDIDPKPPCLKLRGAIYCKGWFKLAQGFSCYGAGIDKKTIVKNYLCDINIKINRNHLQSQPVSLPILFALVQKWSCFGAEIHKKKIMQNDIPVALTFNTLTKTPIGTIYKSQAIIQV